MSKMGYREKCLSQKLNLCNICGADEELLVHHIDGDRDNNDLSNLLPVCVGCHGKVHAQTDKGEKWDKYTSKLPEKSLLKGKNSTSGKILSIEGEKATIRTEMRENGRITIPSKVRQELGIEGKTADLNVTVEVLERHGETE